MPFFKYFYLINIIHTLSLSTHIYLKVHSYTLQAYLILFTDSSKVFTINLTYIFTF